MEKLTALRVFRKVAEVESFSGAARALRMSNAAVSKNVKELEESLGVQLVQRTTRRLHLTAAGEAYLLRTSAILDELDDADASAAETSATPRGLLRVAAPMSIGIVHVAAVVADFSNEHQDITIELEMSDRYVDIIGAGFDIAIRGSGALPDSTLIARKLVDLDRVVCAAPSYLEKNAAPSAPADLAEHDCLIYSLSSSPTQWTFHQADSSTTVEVDGPLRLNNSLAIVEAAVRGCGLAWLPTFVAEGALRSGALRAVLGDWTSDPQSLFAIYPQHRHIAHRLRIFIDYLAERLSTLRDPHGV